MKLYTQLQKAKDTKQHKFVVLIDPDKLRLRHVEEVLSLAMDAGVDYFFIGGSLIVNSVLDDLLSMIKKSCDIPTILFPGNSFQLSYKADGLLFLSLISGRNPELLIGNHVLAAPYLKMSPLEIMSTGYMLIDGGVNTTVNYISNTNPIPKDKEDIAVCTAIAGEMLGLKLMYLDAGSGAKHPVSAKMISSVSSAINIPLIVGGGINTPEKAMENAKHGANVIVVGNAIEKSPSLIKEMTEAVHSLNTKTPVTP